MAGEQKPKSATPSPRKPGDRVTAVLVPQGALAGQPDVPLNRPVTTVGSNDNARLHLVSRTVSKGHAIFVNSGGVTYVADLASRTGVLVNGKLIRDVDLKTGDRVQIGKFLFRYRSAPGASPMPADIPPLASVIVVGSPAKQINGRVFQIGRRDNSDVSFIGDAAVSAGHAVIFEMDGQWYIRDLGSRTGTLVNNKAIHQQVLNFGDRIAIGSSTILFQPGVASVDDTVQPEVAAEETSGLGAETLEIEEDENPRHRPAVPTLRTGDAIPLADDAPLAAVDWKSAFPATAPEEEVGNPLEEIAGTTDEPTAAEEPAAAEAVDDLIEMEAEPVPVEAEPAPVEESIEPIGKDQVEEIPLELEPEPVTDIEELVEPIAVEPEPVLPHEVAATVAVEPEPVADEFSEPIAIEPEPEAVAEENVRPITVEPEPVPADEVIAPIAIEPEPEPIAVKPEPIAAAPVVPQPVAKAAPPKPAKVEPTPQPVAVSPAPAISKPPPVAPPPVTAPDADLDTPVEDFIFVPMDEPVDPNAVPEQIFWGDESNRPAALQAEVPRVTQPANEDQQTEEPQAAPEPEIEAVEPSAEAVAEPTPQSMADAIAEAQQLLADTTTAPAEPAEVEATEAILGGSADTGDQVLADITLAEAAAPHVVDVDGTAIHDVDIDAIPLVDAPLSTRATGNVAKSRVNVPAVAPLAEFDAVATEIQPGLPTLAAVNDVAIDAAPNIDAPAAPITQVQAATIAIDLPAITEYFDHPEAVTSEISADFQPVPADAAAEESMELELDDAPAVATLEAEMPQVAVEIEPEIESEITAEVSDEIVADEPAPEVTAELEPVEELAFDFAAEELAAEAVAAPASMEADETVEPDLMQSDAADEPLDPLSDSFPLVQPVEDTALPADLMNLVPASAASAPAHTAPPAVEEVPAAVDETPRATETVEAPSEITSVNTVDETPTEDRLTMSQQIATAAQPPVADTDEADLEFLDFGEEIPEAAAETVPEVPPAPAVEAAPASSADPLGPAHGPSIFGFQFDGGSFLGGMPISLTTSASAAKAPPPPLPPPVFSPVFDARAKAPSGLGEMLAAPPPAPSPPVVAEIPKPTVRPTTPPRPIINQPAAPVGPTSLTGLVSEAHLPWAAPPVIPPTSREESPVPRPGAAPQKALTSNFTAPGKAARTAEVFSQMSAPIGVEVFGGRPGDPNQFTVPDTQPGDAAGKTTDALPYETAPAAVVPVPQAKKRRLMLPLLILLTFAIPASLWLAIYSSVPVSTPITGSVSYDGLLTQETNDAHAFRVMQQSWIYSDDVRQRAQGILEQKNLPHGFTDSQDAYNGVVNSTFVDARGNTLEFTLHTTDQNLGIEQVRAVMDALAQKDRELDDTKVARAREAMIAKKNVDDLADNIKGLKKQRADEDEKYSDKPDPTIVTHAQQEAARFNQAWLDATTIRENNEVVFAQLQKQDTTHPINVEADEQVVALKAQLQQLQDQINRAKGASAVEAGSKTSIGTDISVGASTQPDANPLLIPLQQQADKLATELDARRAELAADAALGPEQRAVNKAKRVDDLSVKITGLKQTEADAKAAADKAAQDYKDIQDKQNKALLAGARVEDLINKQQEANTSYQKAVSESAEKEAALSRCVTMDRSPEAATKIAIGTPTDMRMKLSSVVAAVSLAVLLLLIVLESRRRPRLTTSMVPAAAPRAVPPTKIPWPQASELQGLENGGEEPVVGEPEQVFGV